MVPATHLFAPRMSSGSPPSFFAAFPMDALDSRSNKELKGIKRKSGVGKCPPGPRCDASRLLRARDKSNARALCTRRSPRERRPPVVHSTVPADPSGDRSFPNQKNRFCGVSQPQKVLSENLVRKFFCQSRLAIDELISPINLGKWCGWVRAILTQNNQLSYGHLYQKQASANNARLCAIAARLLHSFEFLAVDHSPSDEGSALVVRPPRVRSSLVRPDTREDPASYSRLDLVVRRIRCAGGWSGVRSTDPVGHPNKTRRQSNCPPGNKKKLTRSTRSSFGDSDVVVSAVRGDGRRRWRCRDEPRGGQGCARARGRR